MENCAKCETPMWRHKTRQCSIDGRGGDAFANCDDANAIWYGGRFDIAPTANGQNFNTQATPFRRGAVGAVPGEFIRLQPFGNKRFRWVDTYVAPGNMSLADAGFGEVRHYGKPIQPDTQGSFAAAVYPFTGLGCQEAKECGIGLPQYCYPAFGADDPLDVALVDVTAAGLGGFFIWFLLSPIRDDGNGG